LAGSVYALFFFSAFTIAGVSAASGVLFAAALAHRWRAPIQERLPGWLLAGLLLLPAAAVLSALVNPGQVTNVIQLGREYQIFLPLALLPALALVSQRRLLLVVLVPVVVVAVYAVIQHIWGVDWVRPEGQKLIHPFRAAGVFYGKGTFSHHLTFAGYMLLASVMYGGLAWRLRENDRRWWALGAAAALTGVAVSLGRSAWIGAAVGLTLILLGFPRRFWGPLLLGGLLIALVGGVWASGLLRGVIPPGVHAGLIQRVTGTSLAKEERIYIWEAAIEAIKDRPVFGFGYGNDRRYMGPYRKEVSARHDHYKFSIRPSMHAHNVYLEVTVELGVIGLAAYLFFWGTVLYWNFSWIRRSGDRFPFETAMLGAASCALVASMVAGIFENNFFDAEVRTLILILMGLSIHNGLLIRRGLGANSPVGPTSQDPEFAGSP
jgi:O-antigen ligase